MAGTTPNIGLNLPDYGDHNWNVPVNQNWNTLDTAIAGKQSTLTFDSAPASGSTNPVTSDGIYTGLNAKVDKTDLSTVHCVVDTYVSGTSWYRVWSDGWVEQGMTTTVGSKTSTTYTFPHTFSNTNYVIECTQTGDGTSYNNAMGVVKTSASQFTVNNAGGGSTNTFYIYACGY